jgi:hypothetical protein
VGLLGLGLGLDVGELDLVLGQVAERVDVDELYVDLAVELAAARALRDADHAGDLGLQLAHVEPLGGVADRMLASRAAGP